MANAVPHEQLLEAFRLSDYARTGRVARDVFLHVFGQLGLGEEDINRVIDASRCTLTGAGEATEVDYEAFIKWLTGTKKTLDVMDAGQQIHLPANAAPESSFGSWIDRCARLLETRSEADFIQKKLITAQVRAHLDYIAQQSEEEEDDLAPSPAPPTGTLGSPINLDRLRSTRAGIIPEVPLLRWDGAALLQRLLAEGPDGLPVEYVETVLNGVQAMLPAQYPRPLVKLRVPDQGRLIVVGDTHGQLQDALLIFLLHGAPSSKNVYVFNGDVADRGQNACEIFLLIFAFFLGSPNSIILTRGNHEDENMNLMSSEQGGGFYDECLGKYGEGMYWQFVEVFKLLPLAAVVNNEVFVVHGGLPRGPPPSLSRIETINHTAECCPAPNVTRMQDRLFLDLLWSDPMESPGCQPNPRGAGTMWGPDITKAFLQRNKLRWIIRSHELPFDGERGWMEHHLGLVFTVFSASNYCGYEVNWGAVALLTVGSDGHVEQALREHNIPDLSSLAGIAAIPEGAAREDRCREIGLSWVDSDRVAVGERRVQLALRRLAGIVLENKPELWSEFRLNDLDSTGTISRDMWIDSIISVCGDDLPWAEASKCWIPDSQESVNYHQFLSRFKVVLPQEKWCGWKSLVIAEVYEELLSRDAAAHELLLMFDPSGDGVVCVEDFKQLVHSVCEGCLTEPQVEALSRTIFAHVRGKGLHVHDFLARFTLAFVQAKGMLPGETESPLMGMTSIVEQIGRLIMRGRCYHSQPDAGGSKLARTLSFTSLQQLEVGHPVPPVPLNSLDRARTEAPTLAKTALLSRRPSLQSSKLVKAFQSFNDAGDGFLQVEEFVRHVMELDGFQDVRHDGKALDEDGLRGIAEAIAADHTNDGRINLLQFARAFAAVDATGSTELADDLHEHILTFLYRHRHALRTSCAKRDVEGAGRVAKHIFACSLEAVNFCTSRPARHLTQAQMGALVESIAEDDGGVEYEAFLSSFEIHAD
mmetsp:Transcript_70992/g.140986  ORF Transcript_70992/g.140986 Transcript_70992/m.140986 type:complete len:983 (+) Transcript_70992:81-3029(+)